MPDVLELPKKRNLYFQKTVDQASIGELTQQIIDISGNDEYLKNLYKIHGLDYTPQPIKIYIDSYGGYIYQCFGLVSVMERCTTPIHTIVTGCAMSAGFIILVSGHKRYAHRLSTPMYHQASNGFFGKVKDMEDDLAETVRLQKMMEEIVSKRTKITKKKLKEIYTTKTDWTMNADEALKLGVVDEILQ